MIFFLWTLTSLALTLRLAPTTLAQQAHENADGTWRLHYLLSADGTSIRLRITTRGDLSTHWAGFGLSRTGLMTDADTVMGYRRASDEAAVIVDQHAPDYRVPRRDAQRDLTDAVLRTRTVDGTPWLEMTFSRRLVTNDPDDLPITPGRPMRVLWASGRRESDGTLRRHDRRGSMTVTFEAGTAYAGDLVSDGDSRSDDRNANKQDQAKQGETKHTNQADMSTTTSSFSMFVFVCCLACVL